MTNLERASIPAIIALAIIVALAAARAFLQIQNIEAQLHHLATAIAAHTNQLADAESAAAMTTWRIEQATDAISQLTGDIRRLLPP